MSIPKPKKQTIETLKTVAIVALATGIIAFIGGVKYQKAQTTSVRTEVRVVTTEQQSKK